MNCGSCGRWPCLGTAPLVFLLVLSLHLQGSASRCIDTSFGQDLQPLSPGAQPCSIPSGLLQPDVSPPEQGGGGMVGGDIRIVGGRPATFGDNGGSSLTGRPSSQEGSPFQYGRPDKGKPGGAIFGGSSAQNGKSRGPGLDGSGTPQDGPGPVKIYGPESPGQYGANSEQYGDGSHGGSQSGFSIREKSPLGHRRPVWKNPGIPYIPTAQERGGGYIPVSKEPPRYNVPYAVPYGGEAGLSGSGPQYPSTYSGESIASGPRGRYDGSYGPIPEGSLPGRSGEEPDSPCTPRC